MWNSSAELKELLSDRRDYPGLLRVTHGIVDTTVAPNAIISASDEEYFSDVSYIITGSNPINDYQTLEPGSWILGRGGKVLPVSNWRKTGLTSSALSDHNGSFQPNPPTITIEDRYGNVHSAIGITIDFDRFRNNWSDIEITTYFNNVVIDTYYANVDSTNFMLEKSFDNWNKMQLKFINTSVPFRRLRVSNLEFGLYRMDTIFEGAKSSAEYSPISDRLPTETFEWTLFNFDKEFKPGQETGIQKYIMEQQPMKYEWGYPLSNGEIEWVLGGTLLTTGEISFPKDRVTLSATSALSYCTDIYNKGVYSPSGKSMYELAESILLETDLPLNDDGTRRWRLWEGLRSIYTVAPMPKLPGRECLQLIANVSGCVFLPDRTGNISIYPLPTGENPDVAPSSEITTNGEMEFSNAKDIIWGLDLKAKYQFLEPNSWIFGRGSKALPVSEWEITGFTGNVMSDWHGQFQINPKITITSKKIHSVDGLTFRFDEIRNNWSDFIITTYKNGVVVDRHEFVPDSSFYIVDVPFKDWNALEVEFTKTSVPYRYAKVAQLLPGIVRDRIVVDYSTQISSNAMPTQNPPLYSVVVGVGTYRLEELSEIQKIQIEIIGTQTVSIEYQESTNISATVTGGTLVSARYYAAYAELTIIANGTVDISINGQSLQLSTWNYEKQYGITGEILPWSNVLCTNSQTAEIIARTVGNFYAARSIYSADYIGNILIDSLDIVWTENDFDERKSGLVISNNIDYNGAWKGSIKWSNLL